MIRDNPFSSKTFTACWSKHFNNGIKPISFGFLNQVRCYESKIPSLYINIGKNLTKGISYSINDTEMEEIHGKTILFYDVLADSGASGVPNKNNTKSWGHFSIRQYPGYSIHLRSFDSLEDYMNQTFKKSSRYKLRKYKKRLEQCFDVSFKSIGPNVSKEEYDFIFERFRILLEKRFEEKRIHNNNLNQSEWDFYKDVAFPLIKEEKATLFVLYNGNQPISITLGYLADKRIFDAITVFDIDYAKFHLGSIKIMYLIDWAITNNWEILDFSKGYFDYKVRWSNKKYSFHYHILYDKDSIQSKLTAFFLKCFFELKQCLRERKMNQRLHKIRFWLKKTKTEQPSKPLYHFKPFENNLSKKKLIEINWLEEENLFLKEAVFDFLYLNNEKATYLRIFKVLGEPSYICEGQKKILELILIQPK